MSAPARWSLLALCALLLIVGLLQPDPRRAMSATTFGNGPDGYQALLETFQTLGLPVERSYDAAADLPAGATVWWIEPAGVCRAGRESTEDDAGVEDWGGEEWIAAGGTAVVFLPPAVAPSDCRSIAGVDVPARQYASGTVRPGTAALDQEVVGPLGAAPRALAAEEMSTFADAGGGEVVASIAGRPFARLHHLGRGRLVLVADAAFLRNRWLDHADAAPLAMDFVRAFGVPRIDERSHGLHRERVPLRFLLRSAALPALLGMLLLGVLAVWHGHALPPRRAPEAAVGAPTLAAFVDSLARLYAGTGDHARVLERYRQLAAARLRRHFGLPLETPLPALLDRLARSRHLTPAQLAPLADGAAVGSAAGLRAAVRALDRVVEEAMR